MPLGHWVWPQNQIKKIPLLGFQGVLGEQPEVWGGFSAVRVNLGILILSPGARLLLVSLAVAWRPLLTPTSTPGLWAAGGADALPGACSVVITVVVMMVEVVVSWLSSDADPVSSFSPLSSKVKGLASSRGLSGASSGPTGSPPEPGLWGSVWATKGCEVKGEI